MYVRDLSVILLSTSFFSFLFFRDFSVEIFSILRLVPKFLLCFRLFWVWLLNLICFSEYSLGMYSKPTDFHVSLYSVALLKVLTKSKHSIEFSKYIWLLLCENRDVSVAPFPIRTSFISFSFLIFSSQNSRTVLNKKRDHEQYHFPL